MSQAWTVADIEARKSSGTADMEPASDTRAGSKDVDNPATLTCDGCRGSLAGARYVMHDERPHCMDCFTTKLAHTCHACSDVIGVDSKDLFHGSRHWHEQCFRCAGCGDSLANQSFVPHEEQLYCSECHDQKFAARCVACNQPFRAGTRKFDYKGRQWHYDCFKCSQCCQPIGQASFVPRDTDYVCIPCYEKEFAQKCHKCQQVISQGGVTYKEACYHRECFICGGCGTQLAGEKFTSMDDDACCMRCYADQFAKKCSACSKPIAGFDGEKFISFEEQHWHSSCFACHKCKISMVGKGFLMEHNNVSCADCLQD